MYIDDNSVKRIGGRELVIFALLLLLVDQLTKIWIKTHMTINESISVAGDWFYIRFIENNGAAYGFELGGEYGKLALSLFRIVAVILIAFYIRRLTLKRVKRGVLLGFTLIFAGALGNILDSMFYGLIFSDSTVSTVAHFTSFGAGYETFLHGAVVDMLYFPIIDTVLPEWVPIYGGEPYVFFSPIFNLADSYITIGFIYMLLFERRFFK